MELGWVGVSDCFGSVWLDCIGPQLALLLDVALCRGMYRAGQRRCPLCYPRLLVVPVLDIHADRSRPRFNPAATIELAADVSHACYRCGRGVRKRPCDYVRGVDNIYIMFLLLIFILVRRAHSYFMPVHFASCLG